MVWNHRVVRDKNGWLSVREVFYPAVGAEPDGITMEPAAPGGEDVDELKGELRRMFRACLHPIIEEEEFNARWKNDATGAA